MDDDLKESKVAHPRASANPLSALTFWWTHKIFRTGYERDILVDDLYAPLKEHKSSLLGDKFERLWFDELQKARLNDREPKLINVIFRSLGLHILMYGLIRGSSEIFIRVTQPLFLGLLLQYFTKEPEISKVEAYIYATCLVSCSVITALVIHPFMMAMFHIGMKIRVACCSIIYRKGMRLSNSAFSQTTAGQIVNLLSNDVHRFDQMFLFIHYLWIGPLETVIVAYFIWTKVGPAAVGGIVCLLLFIPLQGYLGKMTSVLRFKTAVCTDDRVRLMSEIISGMQVIKFYAWERPFSKLVGAARRKEMKVIRSVQYIRSVIVSLNVFVTRTSIFISVLTYVLLGEKVTAEKVFVVTAYYNLVKNTMSQSFPKAITNLAEGTVSVKRIEKFLQYEEIEIAKYSLSDDKSLIINDIEGKKSVSRKNVHICFTNVFAKWDFSVTDDTLSNINLTLDRGRLLAVIGPVGAGKTSLLQVILKELSIHSGSLTVEGRISYASQVPWIFPSSVRQNILFGEQYDRNRYYQVIKACALERDFDAFTHGDKTLVGERGIMLSGGQKARVCLARAVYRKADIYLLDDPLSAVDPHVGKHLFEACITGLLKDKTCILITHQVQFLKQVDQIVIVNNGKIEAEGTYSELQQSGLDFAKLLGREGENEENKNSDSKETLCFTSQHSIERVESKEDKPAPKQMEELRSTGGVRSSVYMTYFKSGGSCFLKAFAFILFILTPIAAMGGDYWLAHWTNIEEWQAATINSTAAVNSSFVSDVEYSWLPDTNTCLYIYSGIILATVIVTLGRSFLFFAMCTTSSENLHNSMFNSVVHAALHFFNTNPSGRILNRFAKDMGNVDEVLPITLIDCFQIILILLGVVIMVAIINYWIVIPTLVLLVVFMMIRHVFLATSRSVKRLESISLAILVVTLPVISVFFITARSPVFSHLNSTLQGLATVRAFGAQSILEQQFDLYQDLNSTAYYVFVAISRAFGLWLDFGCLIYISIVTFSFLIMDNDTLGGNVGLAITQSLNLMGMFQWGMRQSAEVVNQMTGVERILEMSTIEQEPPLESPPEKKPPSHWPFEGNITFKQVFLKYEESGPYILNNLNFTVLPKEKIGIVGRTGAGKSSLIAALFRLTKIKGSIMIDGIDTSGLGLHEFRSKISIIPQEPVLFSGTLRKNLDPFEEYSDSTLWEALEQVELKETIDETAAGLNCKICEGGSNFSVGQRQLICLARAVVRNNKILVLDEATANVDPRTDMLIQQTVRRKFLGCTVLTIAHRLHTIMDSDRVLVMDNGEVVEFDHPYILLNNKDGYFSSMVDETGKSMAEDLLSIAKENYEYKQH